MLVESVSKRVFQENKAHQFFRKTKISYPMIRTCAYVCVLGAKKCSFFGKFDVLCFLETPVLRFFLLSYYRRIYVFNQEGGLKDVIVLSYMHWNEGKLKFMQLLVTGTSYAHVIFKVRNHFVNVLFSLFLI